MSRINFIISIFLCLGLINCGAQRDHLQLKSFYSKSLEQSLLKITSEKKMVIYLPPSYFDSNREYPVLYYLPGYTTSINDIIDGEYDGFRLEQVMNELVAQKIVNEMIIVICDGSNFLGGNFYANSPLTGNAEDYIVKDIVDYIDSNYRTIKASQSRGIAGHSMGGFGALNIATLHPNIFSVCYSMSPGVYDENGLQKQGLFDNKSKLESLNNFLLDLQNEKKGKQVEVFKSSIEPLFTSSYDDYFLAFSFAYGAVFNYDVTLPFPHIKLPKDTTSIDGVMSQDLKTWQGNGFGDWEIKVKERYEGIVKLRALAFDCGRNDKWITDGTMYLINQLKMQEIMVESFWHSGGHSDQLHTRLKEFMLPYFSEKLAFQE